jgi:transposase InsO family protein
MSHANARLTVHGRRLAAERVLAGQRAADVAAQLGCSRTTVWKWVRRFRAEGVAGLADRSSRPRRCPGATPEPVRERVLALRTQRCMSREAIARAIGIGPRTAGRLIARAGLPPLADLDAITGQPVRSGPMSRVRYERAYPGELIHIDVKKLGRIPEGGGWRLHGRGTRPARGRGAGMDFVHTAIDDRSRLAYVEVLGDERGPTCAGFLERAAAHFASQGIARIQRVMTDNAFNYRLSRDFQLALMGLGARHVLIRPHCPWTNGKAERLNRTLLAEWAYARPWLSNKERAAALAGWLEHYNRERPHGALGGLPPISRVSTTW